LGTAIEAADSFVSCLSPHWVLSPECAVEHQRALELGKRVIPVLLEEADGVPADIAALHWIDARADTDTEAVVDAVLRAIDTDHDRVREHTHWLSRALRWEARERDRSLLLRGADLRAAEDWLSRPSARPAPSPIQTQFIVASQQADHRRRRRNRILATLTGIAVIATTLVVTVLQRSNTVNSHVAESRALASFSEAQLTVDPERALLLARSAWSAAHTNQAIAALDASLVTPTPKLTLLASAKSPTGLTLTRGGSIVMAGQDGFLRAWSVATGSGRGAFTLNAPIDSFMSDADGTRGVAMSRQGRAVFWLLDPRSNSLLSPVGLVAAGATSVAISQDGRTAAVGMNDGTVRLWTWPSQEARTITTARRGGPINCVALSANGLTLVSAGNDGTVVVRHANAQPVVLERYSTPAGLCAIDANGDTVISAAEDGTGVIQRVGTSRVLRILSLAARVAIDPSGKYAALATTAGGVELYNLGVPAEPGTTTFGVAAEPLVQAASGPLSFSQVELDLRFSGDGTLLVESDTNGIGHVWQSATGDVLTTLNGGARSMAAIAVAANDLTAVTGQEDGTLKIWPLPSRPLTLNLWSNAPIDSVEFSKDGSNVLVSQGVPSAYDARTGTRTCFGDPPCGARLLTSDELLESLLPAYGTLLSDAIYSPDDRWLAVGTVAGQVGVWDVKTGDQVAYTRPVKTRIQSMAFSPNGHLLAVAGGDGGWLINPATGHVTASLRRDGNLVSSVSFASDGHRVLTAGQSGDIWMWDLTGHFLRTVLSGGPAAPILALAVSAHDGGVAAAIGSDIFVIQPSNGHISHILSGHIGDVTSLAYDTSSTFLISGGDDGTVRVWNLSTGDQAQLFNMGNGVRAVNVGPSSQRIVAATAANVAAVLTCSVCLEPSRLATEAAQTSTRALTPQERTEFGIR
jgi:WD40 repeat protein